MMNQSSNLVHCERRTKRMLGSIKTRSNIAEEINGVWLPVPKNRATNGYTIVSPNSWNRRQNARRYRATLTFENRNIFNMTLTGMTAKIGSNALMILSALPNFLISLPNLVPDKRAYGYMEYETYVSMTLLGNTLDQNSVSASRPKLTCMSTSAAENPSLSNMAKVLWNTGLAP